MKKIINCELAYTKCFSDCFEDQNILRFRDSLIQDMYDHNFTYVKNWFGDREMFELVKHEISLRRDEHQTFFKMVFGFPAPASLASLFTDPPSVSRLGVYALSKDSYLDLKGNECCSISRIDNPKAAEDKMNYDLSLDKDRLGEDFCRRRAAVREKVYLKDSGVDAYICYHDGVAVGSCELYLHDGAAKIEDFTVLPQEWRKGYGTSILQHLICLARRKKAQVIYLVTDEEDTVKDMYRKFGFEKVHEMTDMLFML